MVEFPFDRSHVGDLASRLRFVRTQEEYLSGAVSMQISESGQLQFRIPYEQAMQGKKYYTTFREAKQAANSVGLVAGGGFRDIRGYQSLNLSHFDALNFNDPTFRRDVARVLYGGPLRDLDDLTDRQVNEILGKNLEIYRFNHPSRQAALNAREIFDEDQEMIFFHGEHQTVGIRRSGLTSEQLNTLLEEHAFEWDPKDNALYKRAKVAIGPKRIDLGELNVAKNLRVHQFDPLDLPASMRNKLDNVIGWREAAAEERIAKVVNAVGKDQTGQLAGLYRQGEELFKEAASASLGADVVEGFGDDKFGLSQRIVDEDVVEEVSKRVINKLDALRAFDGTNFLALEVIEDAIKEVEGILKTRPANPQKYKGMLRELQSISHENAVANLRIAGPMLQELGYDIKQDKGDAWIARRSKLKAAAGVKDDIDVLIPTVNIKGGAGSRKATIFTLEPHLASAVSIDRTSVASGLFTADQIENEVSRMQKSIQEMADAVATGKPIKQGSRAYDLFHKVMEDARSRTGSSARLAEDVLRQMEDLERIPEAHISRALSLVEGSLRKDGAPRIFMGDVIRSAMQTQEAAVLMDIEGAEDLVPGEKMFVDHMEIGLTSDLSATFQAHGGPDNDDTMQSIMQYDPNTRNLYAIDYRNPVTLDEVSRSRVKGGLETERVRDLLRQSDAFDTRAAELKRINKARWYLNKLERLDPHRERKAYQETLDQLIALEDPDGHLIRIHGGLDPAGAERSRGFVGPLAGDQALRESTRQTVLLDLDRAEGEIFHETAQEVFQRPSVIEGRGFKYADLSKAGVIDHRELDDLVKVAQLGVESPIAQEAIEASGVTRIIGGIESTPRLAVGLESLKAEAKKQDEYMARQLSKLGMYKENLLDQMTMDRKSAHMLGSWVNAKSFFDNFLNLNRKTLEGIDPDLARRLVAIRDLLVYEEEIIDVTTKTGGASIRVIADVEDAVEEMYKAVLDTVSDPRTTNLRISAAMFDIMPSVEGKDFIDQHRGDFLTEEDPYSRAEMGIREMEQRLAEAKEDSARLRYREIPISRSGKEELTRLKDELDELGNIGTPDEIHHARKERVLQRFYDNLEYTVVDDVPELRVGRRAAELYAGLARTQYGGYIDYIPGVEDPEALILGRVAPEERMTARGVAKRLRSGYVNADAPFQRDLQQTLGRSLHDDIVNLGALYRHLGREIGEITMSVGKSRIGLTPEGDILPGSIITFPDGQVVTAGEMAADPKGVAQTLGYAAGEVEDPENILGIERMRAAAQESLGEDLKSLWIEAQAETGRRRSTGEADELIDLDDGGRIADDYDRTIMSSYEPDRHRPSDGPVTHKYGFKREDFAKNIRKALDDIPSSVKWGALAAIAGSMIYNSVRDHQHETGSFTVPETMPESNSPYDMGLVMPGGYRQPSRNAPIYQIRTRGGNIDDSLMREIQQITGNSNLDAFLYRDTLRTDGAAIADSILETYR